MKIIVIIFSAIALIATALPLIPSDFWFIRIFDFPRLQISFLLIAALIGAVWFLDKAKLRTWALAVLLIAAIIYQSSLIFKYTFLANTEVLNSDSYDENNTISLLIYNVYMKNDNYKGVFHNINSCDPDIVLTLETDKKWAQELEKIKEKYPYFVEHPLENTYGMILYSRLELIDPEVKFLIEKNVPSIHSKVKLRSGLIVRLSGVHPKPPVPSETTTSTERDAELILVGKQTKNFDGPTIVAGDLNDVAWSHTTRLFQRISGLLDPRVGRGFYNTYNAKIPFLKWPLDHIFHSDHFKLIKLEILPNLCSDHFPVCVHLSYEPEAEHQQEEKSPEGDDIEEADEAIQDATNDKLQ
jgi:endonuclease/exonuclease/phosphatase (EEP) superfamily protein YafD